MKKIIVFAALASALSGCQFLPFTAEGQIALAKKDVKATLVDPASARFSNVWSFEGTVCGRVEAKNEMKAYTGDRGFVWTKIGGLSLEDETDDNVGLQVLKRCTFKQKYDACMNRENYLLIKQKEDCAELAMKANDEYFKRVGQSMR